MNEAIVRGEITRATSFLKRCREKSGTLRGYEVMNMIRIGQLQGIEQGDSVGQAKFIALIFRVAA